MTVTPRVSGFGHFLPSREVTSAEVEELVNARGGQLRIPRGMVEKASGVRSRHWREADEDASTLAAAAAVRAIEHAGVDPLEVDVVVFASASQDVAEPATANLVQLRAGFMRASCFDVKNACCSFLNGLDVAHALVETGRAERVVVAVGEVLSPLAEFDVGSQADLERRFAAMTLGDAGGAVVVEAGRGERGFLGRGAFVSDGRHWEASVIRAGGSAGWGSAPILECDGPLLSELASLYVPGVVDAALRDVGWKIPDVDLVVPHHVSRTLTETVAKAAGFSEEQVFSTLETTGNTAAASIPVALGIAAAEGRCGRGAKVLLLAGAGGFAAGCVPLEL